ncbi:hypothetical protein AVP42_00470 [Agromyces sp. NDB4Y10]|nr:hypothetical protein AVP42_00470 [Agromyces sp. NDB4Y10]
MPRGQRDGAGALGELAGAREVAHERRDLAGRGECGREHLGVAERRGPLHRLGGVDRARRVALEDLGVRDLDHGERVLAAVGMVGRQAQGLTGRGGVGEVAADPEAEVLAAQEQCGDVQRLGVGVGVLEHLGDGGVLVVAVAGVRRGIRPLLEQVPPLGGRRRVHVGRLEVDAAAQQAQPGGVVAGAGERVDGAQARVAASVRVARRGEVVGEVDEQVGGGLARVDHPLGAAGQLPVAVASLGLRDLGDEDLGDERMVEPEPPGRVVFEDPGGDRGPQVALGLGPGGVDGGERAGADRLAVQREHHAEVLGGRRQLRPGLQDGRAEVGRDGRGRGGGGGVDALEEEPGVVRVAARPFEHVAHERLVGRAADDRGHELARRGAVERVEVERPRSGQAEEVGGPAVDGSSCTGPHGGEDRERAVLGAPGEEHERVEGARVGPLQVVDGDDDGSVGQQAIDRVVERERRGPVRGVGALELAGVLEQRSHGEVRHARGEGEVPRREDRGRGVGGIGGVGGRLHERGLADARLAPDQDGACGAAGGGSQLVSEGREFTLPAHELGRVARHPSSVALI